MLLFPWSTNTSGLRHAWSQCLPILASPFFTGNSSSDEVRNTYYDMVVVYERDPKQSFGRDPRLAVAFDFRIGPIYSYPASPHYVMINRRKFRTKRHLPKPFL
ncbi:hypothetical protein LX36DRAFT_393251 [Colletotrichum falcatum]|nr:hypothetical protein LX36DRAFT_393251 [Colletotrichum falcatum]